jgi:hypothetical protein
LDGVNKILVCNLWMSTCQSLRLRESNPGSQIVTNLILVVPTSVKENYSCGIRKLSMLLGNILFTRHVLDELSIHTGCVICSTRPINNFLELLICFVYVGIQAEGIASDCALPGDATTRSTTEATGDGNANAPRPRRRKKAPT